MLRFTTAAIAMLAIAGCTDQGPQNKTGAETIAGTATYLERMALPPNAQLRVTLEDVSLADAPSVTIAKYEAKLSGVPANWQLSYDPADIKSGHRYAIAARITAGDKLLFITTTQNELVNGAPGTLELVLQRVGN